MAHLSRQASAFVFPSDRPANRISEKRFLIEIRALSVAPFPEQTPYPDCLSVCLGEVRTGDESVQELLVALPAFLNREWTNFRQLTEGSLIHAELSIFPTAPERFGKMARVDDQERFDLPIYLATDWEVIPSAIANSVPYQTELPRIQPPAIGVTDDFSVVDETKIAQRMRANLEKIDSQLTKFEGGWKQWERDAEEVRKEHIDQALPLGGFFWERANHYYYPRSDSPYRRPAQLNEASLPVQYAIGIKHYLEQRGVKLLLVPFPWPEEISYLRAISDPVPPHLKLYPARQRLIENLLSDGIDVFDPLEGFIEEASSANFFYDTTDNHPADAAITRTASGIADILDFYGLPRNRCGIARTPIRKRLRQLPNGPDYNFTVFDIKANGLPLNPRILLIGDSFATVPNAYGIANANLLAHLSWELGYQPAFFAVQGQAENILHHLKRHEDMLAPAELVIFVCSPTFLSGNLQFDPYLTRESDWYRADVDNSPSH